MERMSWGVASLVIIFFICIYPGINIYIGVAILIALALTYVKNYENLGKLPPGPSGFPIIGVLPMLVYYKFYVYASMLSKKYGPMIRLNFGANTIIVINDYKMGKELSVHPEFQCRPNSDFLHEFTSGLGIVFSEGPLWKHQRRFTVHSLRDSGMGKLQMQEKIQYELGKVVEEFKTLEGRPASVASTLGKSTSNIISALAFNQQLDYNDPVLLKRIRCLDQNFKLLEHLQVCSSFWWTFPVVYLMKKIATRNQLHFKNEAQVLIEKHREMLDEDNPRDIIDLYLTEMNNNTNSVDEYSKTFFENQLIRLLLDLFGAGTETSSTTIKWAILYMINNVDIQRKVQKELDDVIGSERPPKMEDKLDLPYTVATLQEVERLSCVAPISLPRCNESKVSFGGYTFEPRTAIHFNIYSIHRDPNIWKNPEEFNPSRFIDKDGKAFRPPELMAFGSGKRACLGEGLAKMEIFLYFATLMQGFNFRPVDPRKPPQTNAGSGFTRSPNPYQVLITTRCA